MKALRPGTSQTLIEPRLLLADVFQNPFLLFLLLLVLFQRGFDQGFDFSSAFEGEFGSFEGGEGKSAAVVTNAK